MQQWEGRTLYRCSQGSSSSLAFHFCSFATASEIHVDLLQNDRALDKNNLDSGDSRSETRFASENYWRSNSSKDAESNVKLHRGARCENFKSQGKEYRTSAQESYQIVVDQFTTFKRGFLWLRRNLILRVSLYGSTQFVSSSTARSHRSLNVCSSCQAQRHADLENTGAIPSTNLKEKNETFDSKALIAQRGFSSRSDLGSLIPRGKPFNLLLAIPERCIKAIKASHKGEHFLNLGCAGAKSYHTFMQSSIGKFKAKARDVTGQYAHKIT
nr:hypothetical protein Iba_chr14eCG3490 [Ipomoea batatas]